MTDDWIFIDLFGSVGGTTAKSHEGDATKATDTTAVVISFRSAPPRERA